MRLRDPFTGVCLPAACAHPDGAGGFDVVQALHLGLPGVPASQAREWLGHTRDGSEAGALSTTYNPGTRPQGPSARAGRRSLSTGVTTAYALDGAAADWFSTGRRVVHTDFLLVRETRPHSADSRTKET